MRKMTVKTGLLIVLILAIAGAVFGCGLDDFLLSAGRQITPEGDWDIGSVSVVFEVYSETFYDEDDGAPLLEAKIVYPRIKGLNGAYLTDKLNNYFTEHKDSYLKIIATDGYSYAKSDKDASVKGEYGFVKHSYSQEVGIGFNGNGLLSIVYKRVEDTGGVRPNVFQSSVSFNLRSGRRLTLDDLLGYRGEWTVYSVVRRKIQETEKTTDFIYYENYREAVEKLYDPEDLYLTESGLRFFYQPYTLAPFAAGIPEFEMPFEDMRMRMKIPQSEPNGGLNEAYRAALGLIERNYVIFSEIYGLRMLEMNIPLRRENNEFLFPVIDPRFTRYEELSDYLRGTYVWAYADELLADGRYTDVYGSLYGDIRKDVGVGYYVNWREYGIEIEKLTGDSADIKISTTEELPSGTKSITISARMIRENGRWLLEKMIY